MKRYCDYTDSSGQVPTTSLAIETRKLWEKYTILIISWFGRNLKRRQLSVFAFLDQEEDKIAVVQQAWKVWDLAADAPLSSGERRRCLLDPNTCTAGSAG